MKRLRLMMPGIILARASTLGVAQQPQTATELSAFRANLAHLSSCAQLAKKILDTRDGHGADWGDLTVSVRYELILGARKDGEGRLPSDLGFEMIAKSFGRLLGCQLEGFKFLETGRPRVAHTQPIGIRCIQTVTYRRLSCIE